MEGISDKHKTSLSRTIKKNKTKENVSWIAIVFFLKLFNMYGMIFETIQNIIQVKISFE